jgi:hypothetical protein
LPKRAPELRSVKIEREVRYAAFAWLRRSTSDRRCVPSASMFSGESHA